MSYTNTYYPDYEKMYPGVKITPEVLAALRASDRQMRRFENELKTERFEADNEKQVARFIPSREDSYERLVEADRLQFADEEMSVEDAEIYCAEGHFAPGSMLPKVKAAISFAKAGGTAIIASLENAGKAVRGESGTVIHL